MSLSSLSNTDGLSLQVYGPAASGFQLADGTHIAPAITMPDRGDLTPASNNTLATALTIDDIHSLARITGATLHNAADVDYYRFTLSGGRSGG